MAFSLASIKVKEEGYVLILNDVNFEQEIKRHDQILINFSADWW